MGNDFSKNDVTDPFNYAIGILNLEDKDVDNLYLGDEEFDAGKENPLDNSSD